jgi:hypothetical protein
MHGQTTMAGTSTLSEELPGMPHFLAPSILSPRDYLTLTWRGAIIFIFFLPHCNMPNHEARRIQAALIQGAKRRAQTYEECIQQ